MSTKTNFKRIALVAVSALGLGLLSSVPVQAAFTGAITVTTTNGTATVQRSDSTTAATIAVQGYSTNASGDSIVITVTAGRAPSGAASFATTSVMLTALDTSLSTGGATVLNKDTDTAWSTAGGLGLDSAPAGKASPTIASTGAFAIVDPAGAGQPYGKFGVFLDTALARTVGTYIIDYLVEVYDAGVATATQAKAGQVSIVVSNSTLAAAGAVAAASTSSAVFYGAATFADNNTLDSTSVSAVNTPDANGVASIRVTLKTAAGLPAQESITVTSTVGNVGSTCATAGKSLTIVGDTDGIQDLLVCGDGSSGTSTITIKSTSVTFTNKSITFYGATATKITATSLLTTIGTSAVNAILAKPTDSLGTVIRTNDAVYYYSDATSVVNSGTSPAGTSCGNYNAVYDGFLCQLTGVNSGTANITIRNASTSTAATVSSTAVPVVVNTAAAAKFTLAFNKASYAPGEKAYIIVKALDAAGKVHGGGTLTNLFATGGISSSAAFGNGSETTTAVTLTTAGTTASDGVASTEAIKLYTVYMPSSGGTVKITATGGSLLPLSGQVEVSASATVTNDAAAALAAVNALATTVASLRTLITTLTNLVLKIQKKVKA